MASKALKVGDRGIRYARVVLEEGTEPKPEEGRGPAAGGFFRGEGRVRAVAKRSAGLPADYNPEKGLKKIAVAEAAEKHFARAKDATKLYEAIEAKLIEQRRFVLWWDAQEKDPGFIGKPGPGRGHKTP